ncbi:ABC transporter ATP-binding protein [Pontibacillus salicampi]|uniref:ABC transporter ATP-binding protein n=1 Tax=Pontibacillus salicampi TaxID=1449801 RepID=A0ABV6LNI0_9BACI
MSTTAVVQLDNLSKTIKGKKLIHNVNLDLYGGEVFGFLGPNGAGKTTTIRMMVGLMKPTSGSVKINGVDLQEQFETAVSQVGAIVENPELYKHLSGYQNLIHYSRMHKGITKKRLQEVIDQVGLTNRIHDKVKSYSLGMRQRLGLGQALLHSPKFLILDEPTNGLDPAGIREFRTYLRQIAQEDNVCILVSSHLLSEIELMCDRVGIIQKGTLIDIKQVHGDDQQVEWKFVLDQPAQAMQLLSTNIKEEVRATTDGVSVTISQEQVPAVNKLLVEAGFNIYSIESTRETLEDEFLKVTRGEQVG